MYFILVTIFLVFIAPILWYSLQLKGENFK
jgi:hypothetical protein